MSESQSRYSIVERLTKRKLEIMGFKSKLDSNTRDKKQKIEKLRKSLENWKEDIKEDNKREQRKKELEIERAKQDFENSQEQKSEKQKVYDEQIKAIEEALNSIEEISKTSAIIQT